MPRRTSVLAATATAMALALATGPLAAPALASPGRTPVPCVAAQEGPDIATLGAELAELPDASATAATVRVGGTCTWSAAGGVRDVRTQAPAMEEARFRAGSVTKVVTASIVLQLAAEGRISLDGTVQQYLPGLLDDAFEPITVRQLLNYTSGLKPGSAQPGATVDESYPHRFETVTPREVVAASVAAGPGSAPGKRQSYSNIHYTVLGLLIEKITDDTYAHQAKVRVFRPLGMRHSSFPVGTDPRIHGPHNRGYDWIDGELTDVTEWNMADRWAAGDLISTTADLEQLVKGLFSGRVVPEPQLQEMFTVPDIDGASFGAGLQRFELYGQELWGKTGSRPGYATGIAATRDLSRTVVYSVNSTEAKEDGQAVAERFGFPAFRP
ncbi:serine hydrolase domain-containing protein [Streptomyces sp. NPDC051963]|uniref:serine hydrolase domain-containing protein n=1 Tax=Streptomyces sp. NPDC051963 TaxID=3365678 RepID=UPI0037D4D000